MAIISVQGGDDVVTNSGKYAIIELGDGNDNVQNDGNDAVIIGGNGNNKIINYGNKAMICGVNGSNTITSYGSDAVLVGGAGNDVLISENDGLSTLVSGSGQSTLTGSSGANMFVYTEGGSCVITNYDQTRDYIILSGCKVKETVTAEYHNDVIIKVESSDTGVTGLFGDVTIQGAKGKVLNILDQDSVEASQKQVSDVCETVVSAAIYTFENDENIQDILTNGVNGDFLKDLYAEDAQLA